MFHASVLILAVLAADAPAPGLPATAQARKEGPKALRMDGRWVLDEAGKPVPPRDFERGLQTGALVLRKGELWSIGDQRAEWPGRLLRIDPKTARLIGVPIAPVLKEPSGGNLRFNDYQSIPNSDFEGLAKDPRDPTVLYGVTEDKRLWVVRFRIEDGTAPKAAIDQITELEFPGVQLYPRESSNYRLEGIVLSDDGKTMYFAWERTADNLPRIFSLPTEEGVSGKLVLPKEVPIDFGAVPPREDKPKALLNLNDIRFLRRGAKPCLLAIARDQERLLLIGLDTGKVERIVDIDFRAPDGESMMWTSPEGLEIDEATDRLWLITDPDSMRGNYRKLKDQEPEGNFAQMAPLLFEAKLSAVLEGDR
jgi:hypothetical protein